MNFSFMITIIFVILIFIKINMNQIPNYGFLLFVIGLLGIIELYNFKENFKPTDMMDFMIYHKIMTFAYSESSSDRDGLKCQIEKI